MGIVVQRNNAPGYSNVATDNAQQFLYQGLVYVVNEQTKARRKRSEHEPLRTCSTRSLHDTVSAQGNLAPPQQHLYPNQKLLNPNWRASDVEKRQHGYPRRELVLWAYKVPRPQVDCKNSSRMAPSCEGQRIRGLIIGCLAVTVCVGVRI